MVVHNKKMEPQKVSLEDAGPITMICSRRKRINVYIGDETIMFTYGDGVSGVDGIQIIKSHKSHSKISIMKTIQLCGRFDMLDIDQSDYNANLKEKSKDDCGRINGGFMILEPEDIDYIECDTTTFER